MIYKIFVISIPLIFSSHFKDEPIFAAPNEQTIMLNPNTSISTKDFLKNEQGCNVQYWHGSLNALHSKDSIGYLGFAGFYDCDTTYEIIFLYKDLPARVNLGYDSLSKIFFDKKIRSKGFVDFTCYAFVLPCKNPETQEDLHKVNIDFPVAIKAYKRISNNSWEFVGGTTAHDLNAYTEFQFHSIYKTP